MSLHVFLAVIFAAALHAGWNATLKLRTDRASAVVLLSIMQAVIALPLLAFVQQPAQQAWAWIAGAAALHSGYKLMLIRAYAHADLTQAYPVARGTAPLIVAAFSYVALSESLSLTGTLAVGLISAGILLIALAGGKQARMQPRGLMFALATAGFTASYTLFDATGARVAGTASGFILWMVIGDALLMCCYALFTRGAATLAAMRPALVSGTAAGAMSLGSYWIAVWAFTQAPVALVASLRETSILFAVAIGVAFLGERLTPSRVAAAMLIVAGMILLRL
ncbi:MAG: EamA family transporter [Rhodobiaceae bacterium]|nr:EamA family transporter [Rhodobiaceae bacterium]